MLKADHEFASYFPTYAKEKTLPERDYFFDVLGTLRPQYLQRIVAFANKQRGKKGERPETAYIACNPAFLDELKQCNSISSKMDCGYLARDEGAPRAPHEARRRA